MRRPPSPPSKFKIVPGLEHKKFPSALTIYIQYSTYNDNTNTIFKRNITDIIMSAPATNFKVADISLAAFGRKGNVFKDPIQNIY